MRAVVTGASGFVGRHLLDHLAAAGDEVVASEAEITDPEPSRPTSRGLAPTSSTTWPPRPT